MAAAKLVLWLLCLVMLVDMVIHVDARCRGCTRNGRSKAKRGQQNEASPETTETCNGPLCVRKCCPAGTYFDGYDECARDELSLWSPSTTFLKDRMDVDESKLQVLFGLPPGCSEDDLVVVEGPFKLLPDGKMLAPSDDTLGPASTSRYCLEIAEDYDGLFGIYCRATLEDYEEV